MRVFDLEPALRGLFVIGLMVSLVSAIVLGAGAQAYVEDIISGRPADWYPGLRSYASTVGQAGLLSAFVCIAIAWYQMVPTRLPLDRPRDIGLATVCFGAVLGAASDIWIWASGNASSFDALRLHVWVGVAGGFCWPLVALGLGLMTFFS